MKLIPSTLFVPMLCTVFTLGLAPAAAQTVGTMTPVPAAAPAKPETKPETGPEAKPAGKLAKTDEFPTITAAAAHCPDSTVVWSSLAKSHSFHTSASRYFGKTRHGAYVCEGDALAAGFHQAKS